MASLELLGIKCLRKVCDNLLVKKKEVKNSWKNNMFVLAHRHKKKERKREEKTRKMERKRKHFTKLCT